MATTREPAKQEAGVGVQGQEREGRAMGHESAVGCWQNEFWRIIRLGRNVGLIDDSLRGSRKEVSAGWDSEGELELGRKSHQFHPHTLGDPLQFFPTEPLGPIFQLLCSGLNCDFHAFDSEPGLSVDRTTVHETPSFAFNPSTDLPACTLLGFMATKRHRGQGVTSCVETTLPRLPKSCHRRQVAGRQLSQWHLWQPRRWWSRCPPLQATHHHHGSDNTKDRAVRLS